MLRPRISTTAGSTQGSSLLSEHAAVAERRLRLVAGPGKRIIQLLLCAAAAQQIYYRRSGFLAQQLWHSEHWGVAGGAFALHEPR